MIINGAAIISISTVWVKKITLLRPAVFWHFSQTVENFKSIFTHLLYVPIYARLQIFIQLSPTLTKLCHIKCNHLVHIICPKCPPSAETHAFRCLRKSLIPLLIVVCGKSSQICCVKNWLKIPNRLEKMPENRRGVWIFLTHTVCYHAFVYLCRYCGQTAKPLYFAAAIIHNVVCK